MTRHIYEPCGVCGSTLYVEAYPSRVTLDGYVPLCSFIDNTFAYSLMCQIIMGEHIKKNMCAKCRTSILTYSKTAIKKIDKNYTYDDIEEISTRWVSKRLQSLIRNRYKKDTK